MPRYNVLLIRSEHIGLDGLRHELDIMSDIGAVYDIADADQAMISVGEYRPDLVVLGADSIDGEPLLALIGALRERSPASRFVVLADRVDDVSADDLPALQGLGLDGQLLWSDVTPARFDRCVLTVIEDGFVVRSRAIAESFLSALRFQQEPPPQTEFTPRERVILQGLAREFTREEIATAADLSVRQVNRIIAELEARLGVTTLFALGVRYASPGLVR